MSAVPLRQRIRSGIGSLIRRRMARRRDQFLGRTRRDCQGTQEKTLQRLLQLNADSEFSRTHGLHAGLTTADFQKRFPIADYDTFRSSIQQVVKGNHRALLGSGNILQMFALTSGTTASIKQIPLTRQFVRDYRRGWSHWAISVYEQYPKLKLLKIVQLISSHQVSHTEDGTPCGNISGLVASMQNPIVRKLYSVPHQVAQVPAPDTRRFMAARFAIQDPWVGLLVTANPSSLISLMNSANANAELIIRDIHNGAVTAEDLPDDVRGALGSRCSPNAERAAELEDIFERHGEFFPAAVWPDHTVLGVWTGGSVAAYLPELRLRFGDLPIRDHGLHASEGRMTIPVCDNSASGILDIDSHYFEFIPERELESTSPVTLQAHELEVEQNYGILLTTSSGFYRYNIHDVVRCTGFHGSTPLLEFLHKGARISSITGEKITESQVVRAWGSAIQHMALSEASSIEASFTLTPVWGDPPGYELFLAGQLSSSELSELEFAFDEQLMKANCEYEDKRGSGRLCPVKCNVLTSEEWTRFQTGRLKATGGSAEQYKHPFLLPDPEFKSLFRSAISMPR